MSETTITLNLTGLHCHGCASTVHRSISKLEGVQNVTINLQQAKATVTYDPEKVSIEDMKERVQIAGYGVADQN